MPRQALIVEVTPEDLGTLQFLAGMLMGMGQVETANDIRKIASTVAAVEVDDDEQQEATPSLALIEGTTEADLDAPALDPADSPDYIPEPEPHHIIDELPPGTPPAIPGSLGAGPPPNDNP